MKLTVSDTGTGIETDIIHSIFEPYFTTKELGEGTGMGLAMVHGIIHSYGGGIFVKSDAGKADLANTVRKVLDGSGKPESDYENPA